MSEAADRAALVARTGLTAEHRAAIMAALPSGVEMTKEAWAELEEAVATFLWYHSARQRYPIAVERKRWERIGTLTTKLVAELEQLPTPLSARALEALAAVTSRVEMRAAFHATEALFDKDQDPHRELFLYEGVLRVWTDHLGRPLRYSPTGPLARFFTACVKPVLGDATPRAGIREIVERYQERCDWMRRQKDEYLQKKKHLQKKKPPPV